MDVTIWVESCFSYHKFLSLVERRRFAGFTLPVKKKTNLFALKNSERELWVRADTPEDREDWVRCIRAVIEVITEKKLLPKTILNTVL